MKIDPRNIEIIEEQMVEIFQKMSGEQKWMLASQMHRSVRLVLRAYIISQNLGWSEEQIEKEMARRLGYGTD